jgi:hypothetical protein
VRTLRAISSRLLIFAGQSTSKPAKITKLPRTPKRISGIWKTHVCSAFVGAVMRQVRREVAAVLIDAAVVYLVLH